MKFYVPFLPFALTGCMHLWLCDEAVEGSFGFLLFLFLVPSYLCWCKEEAEPGTHSSYKHNPCWNVITLLRALSGLAEEGRKHLQFPDHTGTFPIFKSEGDNFSMNTVQGVSKTCFFFLKAYFHCCFYAGKISNHSQKSKLYSSLITGHRATCRGEHTGVPREWQQALPSCAEYATLVVRPFLIQVRSRALYHFCYSACGGKQSKARDHLIYLFLLLLLKWELRLWRIIDNVS